MSRDDQETSSSALRNTPELIVKQVEAAAVQHYQAERFDRARELLSKLLQMRPDSVQYWTLLGVCYRRQGKKAAGAQVLQGGRRARRYLP